MSKYLASPMYGTSGSCWQPGARSSTWCGRADIAAPRNASTLSGAAHPGRCSSSTRSTCTSFAKRARPKLPAILQCDAVTAVTRELELEMVRDADVTLVVSESERSALVAEVPDADVRVVSNVQPTASSTPAFAERLDMLFVGALSHSPNVDAIHWYASEVWPLVRRRLPDARTFVIGSDMPETVRKLAGNGMEAVGFVPDLEPYLRRCRLSVAPLRFGAGVKGKISAAQAAGLSVVATSIAVEGMNLEPGRDVLVADTAEAFADAIVRLHEDEMLWARVASGGRENVARYFSAEVARPVLAGLVAAAAAPQTPAGWSLRMSAISFSCLPPMAAWETARWCMGRSKASGAGFRERGSIFCLSTVASAGTGFPALAKSSWLLHLPAQNGSGGAFRRIVADYDCFALLGADVLDGHYSVDESLARLSLLRLADAFGLETRVLGFSMNEHPAEAACAAFREIGAFAPLFVRDPLSMSRLEGHGVPGLVPAADVAFLMRPDSTSPSSRRPRAWIEEQRAAGRPVIAIGLSSHVLAEAMRSGKADLLQNCISLIKALERSHHASVLILPHDLRPVPPAWTTTSRSPAGFRRCSKPGQTRSRIISTSPAMRRR